MKDIVRAVAVILALTSAACTPQEAPREAQIAALRLTDQGYEFLENSQFKAAAALFDQAIKADGRNIRAYQGKGIAFDQLGKHNEAESAYKTALDIDPKAVSIRNNLAMSYIMRGEYDKAIEELAPLAESEPNNVTVQENLALVNCLMGKRDDARKLYGKSLKPSEIEDNLRFCNKFETIRKNK